MRRSWSRLEDWRAMNHALRPFGLVIAAGLALSGCSAAQTTSPTAASSPAASPSTASLPAPDPSASASPEAAPAGYRFVEAPRIGLTLAIPKQMTLLASGTELQSLTEKELKAEAEAEGKTVEQFHARWDNVDVVAYAKDVSDDVISIEVTVAPDLTTVPTADSLAQAATKSGLQDPKTFQTETVFGTANGFEAHNAGKEGSAGWQMASVYAATTQGTVFSMTVYTADETTMAKVLPTIIGSWATVG